MQDLMLLESISTVTLAYRRLTCGMCVCTDLTYIPASLSCLASLLARCTLPDYYSQYTGKAPPGEMAQIWDL